MEFEIQADKYKMSYFLGDMISRINNAQRTKLPAANMFPFLPIRDRAILKILYKEGYIRGYKQYFNVEKKKNIIKVLLKYNIRGEPIIKKLFSISTPGRRIFISIETLWQAQSSTGLYILSTSKGYLTDIEARRLNVGGELLLGIW